MAACPVIANRDPMRKLVPCLPRRPMLPLLAAGFLLIPAFQSRFGAEASASDPLSLRLAPDKTTLRWKGASQQFSVVATFAGGRSKEVTAQAEFSLAHPAVARPGPAGRVMAVGDGETRLQVTFGSLKARATVVVVDSARPLLSASNERSAPSLPGGAATTLPATPGSRAKGVSGFPSTPLIPGRITIGSSRAASFRY